MTQRPSATSQRLFAILRDRRIAAAFWLWDVVGATLLGGQQYFGRPDNFRRVADIISNQIYERLADEKGYFETNALR